MTPDNASLIVDGFLCLLLLISFISGWRQGALAAILSTIGVIAGLVCGAALAPFVMSYTESCPIRFLLALSTVILLVGIGNLVGGMAGSSLRERMKTRSSVTIDSAVGALFQTFTALLVAWLIAIPLATATSGSFAQGIRGSSILHRVDRVAPNWMNQLPNTISAMLNESGLPPLLSPFEEKSAREVEAPRIDVSDPAMVERLRKSVIHVSSDSSECHHTLSGSGFVAADDYVITNAHVVAGTERVRLDTVLGIREAKVVLYDPDNDIAVLHSEGLGLPTIPWATDTLDSGDDAVVMGFPGSGPFTATTARIRERLVINGPDIYSSTRIDREAYVIRGEVRQGNSGGPLVNSAGEVIGVVFGAAVDGTDTGYALTAKQVKDAVGDLNTLSMPVNTQHCIAQ